MFARRPLLLVRKNGGLIFSQRWMSARPELPQPAEPARKKITLQRLYAMRAHKKPITMLTAYDYPTGLRSERAGIDVCLVGDSLAQVALGYDSTTRLSLDEMIHHLKAVARGAKSPLLLVDMPFGTYATGTRDAVSNAIRLVREGGADAVKLEGAEEIVDVVKALTRMGIPVVGHIGLLPQRHTALSGYRVQGKDAPTAQALFRAAQALQSAGAFAIVLEAIPHRLASHITSQLDIPTIGIGAGPGCSGQVLVHDDALGIWNGHQARFVRRFSDVGSVADQGAKAYAEAVRSGDFPNVDKESYEMDEEQWKLFKHLQEPTIAPSMSTPLIGK